MPSPSFPNFADDDEPGEKLPSKDQVIHIRLIPLLWLWVKYAAKESQTSPSEWIRQALHDFDGDGAEDNRGKVLHVRVSSETLGKIRQLTKASRKAPAEWARCAINRKLMLPPEKK